MLSLPKRNPDKAGSGTPAWHPNFRNFAQLPDTKVVRTSFFVNGIAIVVSVALLLLVSYQEYRLADYRRQIKGWDEQIARARPGSAEAVSLFRQFKEEEAKVTELSAFYADERVKFSTFIFTLGKLLPRDVAVESIDCKENEISIHAVVKGIGDQATKTASAFEKLLQANEEMKPKFDVSMTNFNRDIRNQRMLLDIVFKYKTPAKKP